MKKKSSFLIYIVFVIINIGIAVADFFFKGNPYTYYAKILIGIILIGYLLFAVGQIVWVIRDSIRKWLKDIAFLIVVIVPTVVVPIAVHFIFYPTNTIDESSWLTSYSDYLTFIGALGLGYFLYKRDEKRREVKIRKKARLLYELMFETSRKFSSLETLAKQGIKLPFSTSWREDYLDICHLIKNEKHSLRFELEFFFNTVNLINSAIEAKDEKRVMQIYENFVKKEQYSRSDYNYTDAVGTLLSASIELPQSKTWKQQNEDKIREYTEEYFDVVNLWVGNYMLKHEMTTCESEVVKYELVDWLITNPELKNWVRSSYEKRKISEVVSRISLDMNKKSDTLSYYWGEYNLKNSN